jgi:hypothetical protein
MAGFSNQIGAVVAMSRTSGRLQVRVARMSSGLQARAVRKGSGQVLGCDEVEVIVICISPRLIALEGVGDGIDCVE